MSQEGEARTTARQVWGIFIGKPVVDAAGRHVGTVAAIRGDRLVVRCGYLFHKEETIERDQIDRYEDGKLVLKRRE